MRCVSHTFIPRCAFSGRSHVSGGCAPPRRRDQLRAPVGLRRGRRRIDRGPWGRRWSSTAPSCTGAPAPNVPSATDLRGVPESAHGSGGYRAAGGRYSPVCPFVFRRHRELQPSRPTALAVCLAAAGRKLPSSISRLYQRRRCTGHCGSAGRRRSFGGAGPPSSGRRHGKLPDSFNGLPRSGCC